MNNEKKKKKRFEDGVPAVLNDRQASFASPPLPLSSLRENTKHIVHEKRGKE